MTLFACNIFFHKKKKDILNKSILFCSYSKKKKKLKHFLAQIIQPY